MQYSDTCDLVKIRLMRPPRGPEFDEFDLKALRVGAVMDVSTRLATLLIISGDAEPLGGPWDRAEADDASALPRKGKPKLL